jgi:hypothetical protein
VVLIRQMDRVCGSEFRMDKFVQNGISSGEFSFPYGGRVALCICGYGRVAP